MLKSISKIANFPENFLTSFESSFTLVIFVIAYLNLFGISYFFLSYFLSYFPQQFHISIYLSEFTFSLSQSTLSLSIPSNFLLIFILLPRAIKDPLSHPAPISSSFFFEIFLRRIRFSPTLLSALRCPHQESVSGVCLKIICTYTCPSAKRSLRETRDYR